MTVASLWKSLDRAGCGKAVGANEIVDQHKSREKVNPWNYNEMKRSEPEARPTLAVDLSIWICESLTSSAMGENHADPSLLLVYTRTVKLLSLGVKLVVVIEGKRRIRRTEEDDENHFRMRRSGTAFWKACNRCEEMLRLLGVPVVRAKAEGEALCALLNQSGIVDGVISNDGDCLLFGAKVIYTKFSIENLEQSRVMRYCASDIRAFVDDDDDDQCHQEDANIKKTQLGDLVQLSREDLIAFAILTGSDLAGNGISKVGCRKAIRFIRKCQLDNPLKTQTAAIEELTSWAKAACIFDKLDAPQKAKEGKQQHCSCCNHPGTKRSHQKNGCKTCGTEAGETCIKVSPGGRFRKTLRSKALAMKPKFDPVWVIEAYQKPNDNQIPFVLVGKTANSMQMELPRLREMLQSSMILKGHSLAASRDYVRQSLERLLVRSHLFSQVAKGGKEESTKMKLSHDKPIPQKITRRLTRNGTLSFEIVWAVNATITDEQGNGIDGYDFLTVEAQDLIAKCYPNLIESFQEAEKEMRKQGDAEQERRRTFLESFLQKAKANKVEEGFDRSPPKKKRDRQVRRRDSFFQQDNSLFPHGHRNLEAIDTRHELKGADPDRMKLAINQKAFDIYSTDGEGVECSQRHKNKLYSQERPTLQRNHSDFRGRKSRPKHLVPVICNPSKVQTFQSPEESILERRSRERRALSSGEGVQKILRINTSQVANKNFDDYDFSSIETESHSSQFSSEDGFAESGIHVRYHPGVSALTPGHEHFLRALPLSRSHNPVVNGRNEREHIHPIVSRNGHNGKVYPVISHKNDLSNDEIKQHQGFEPDFFNCHSLPRNSIESHPIRRSNSGPHQETGGDDKLHDPRTTLCCESSRLANSERSFAQAVNGRGNGGFGYLCSWRSANDYGLGLPRRNGPFDPIATSQDNDHEMKYNNEPEIGHGGRHRDNHWHSQQNSSQKSKKRPTSGPDATYALRNCNIPTGRCNVERRGRDLFGYDGPSQGENCGIAKAVNELLDFKQKQAQLDIDCRRHLNTSDQLIWDPCLDEYRDDLIGFQKSATYEERIECDFDLYKEEGTGSDNSSVAQMRIADHHKWTAPFEFGRSYFELEVEGSHRVHGLGQRGYSEGSPSISPHVDISPNGKKWRI